MLVKQVYINTMFYLKCGAAWIWFLLTSIFIMAIVLFRWKDPSLGSVFARTASVGALRIMGWQLVVENSSRLYTNQPCVYVANHQTNFDILTMGGMYPYRTAVIAKKELAWVPFFGQLFVFSGNILIDRKNRKDSLQGLGNALKALVEKKISIWIFPEGTRNQGKDLMLPFKKGAFYLAIQAGVPIVPFIHQKRETYFDLKNKKIISGSVLIRVLEPIQTKGLSAADVPHLMQKVRETMEKALTTDPRMGFHSKS